MKRILFLVLFISFNSYGTDWKLIGFANSNKPEWIFFDKDDIDTLVNGNLKIWVKSITALNGSKKDSVLVKTIANKIAFGYMPPYAFLHNSKLEETLDITGFETMAELQRGELKGLLLVEINLKLKQFRRLSATIYKNGEGIEDNKISNWEYIKPETNFKTLFDILQLKNYSQSSNK